MIASLTFKDCIYHLNMIHNVNRPFHEMMLGLESFIPMYMTGQISPYYLPGMQPNVFRRMLWVSGAAALQGDCLDGHIGDGRMYLTHRKSDIAQYQKQAGQLLRRASPLMELYGSDRKEAFIRFLQVIAFAANAVMLLASLIPARGAGIPFIGKAAGFCRHARKAALIGLLVSLAVFLIAYPRAKEKPGLLSPSMTTIATFSEEIAALADRTPTALPIPSPSARRTPSR